MTRFQQETAVLLICNVILFAEFKTTLLGFVMLFLTSAFGGAMWKQPQSALYADYKTTVAPTP